MSQAVVALILLCYVAFFYGSLVFFRNFPNKEVFNVVRWFFRNLHISLDYWKANSELTSTANVVYKSLILSRVLSLRGTDLRKARFKVRDSIRELHAALHPEHKPDASDTDIAVGAYLFLVSHEDLFNAVAAIRENHGNLNVQRATTLAIDVLGEIVSRKSELGQIYFQQLIYGINRILLIIRDKGTDKKALKEVVSVLFRVYQLTRAYRHQKGLSNLSEVEFYAKAINLFNTMRKLYDDSE